MTQVMPTIAVSAAPYDGCTVMTIPVTDFPSHGVVPHRRVRTWGIRACGGVLLLCGLIGLAAATVPGRVSSYAGELQRWRFPATVPMWAIALLFLGVAMTVVPRRVPLAATAVGGLLAALVAGESFVGVRDWFNVAGSVGINLSSLADVVTLAAGASVAGVAATAASAAAVWPDAWRGRGDRYLLVAAAGVAAGVPLVLIATGAGPFTTTALGAAFLSQGLPCAAGLAVAAFCRRDVRAALLGTVVIALAAGGLTSILQNSIT